MNLWSWHISAFQKIALAFLTPSRWKCLYNYDYIYCDVSKLIWQGVLVSHHTRATGKGRKRGESERALYPVPALGSLLLQCQTPSLFLAGSSNVISVSAVDSFLNYGRKGFLAIHETFTACMQPQSCCCHVHSRNITYMWDKVCNCSVKPNTAFTHAARGIQPPQPVTLTTLPFPVSKRLRLQIWVHNSVQWDPGGVCHSLRHSGKVRFSPDTQMLVGTWKQLPQERPRQTLNPL